MCSLATLAAKVTLRQIVELSAAELRQPRWFSSIQFCSVAVSSTAENVSVLVSCRQRQTSMLIPLSCFFFCGFPEQRGSGNSPPLSPPPLLPASNMARYTARRLPHFPSCLLSSRDASGHICQSQQGKTLQEGQRDIMLGSAYLRLFWPLGFFWRDQLPII